MVDTKVKHLRLTRLSAMPNKNKSYAYRIENAEDEGVAELLEEVDGIYDAADGGGKLLYSPNRLGGLNVAARQEIRIVESRDGRNFINLVNTKLDAVAGFFDTVALAEKFGIKDSANAAAAFVALSGGRVAAATPAPAPIPIEEKEEEQQEEQQEEQHEEEETPVLNNKQQQRKK